MPRCVNTKSAALVAFLLGLALLPAAAAAAIDSSWNANASGNWSDAAKWTAGVPNAINDIARLTYNITAARTVTIDGSTRTVGSLYLNDDNFGYTLAGVGLKIDVSSGSALIQSDGGTGVTHTISAPVTLNDSATVAVNSATLQISGIISSGVAGTGIAKTGAGTLTLTAANTFSGPTTISGGILSLSGASGAITSAAGGITVNTGGTLKLDNTSTANNGNRLADTVVLTMNGGTLNFSNDAGAANFSETVGQLNLMSGASTVMTSQAASGKTSTLTFSTNPGIVRAAGATVNFTGTGLGTDTRNRIVFTTAPTLDDGIIGGWAVSGNDFTKYVISPVTSVAPLASGDYYTGASSSWTSTHNVKLTGGTTTTSGTTVVNSLNIAQTSAATLSLGAGTLRVESGGVLISGAYSGTIQSGALTAGTGTAGGDLIIYQNSANDATISANINNNGSSAVSLVKVGTGAGSLILSGANTYTGATTVSQGTLCLGANNALPSGSAITVQNGSTLDIRTYNSGAGALALIDGTISGTTGVLSGSSYDERIGRPDEDDRRYRDAGRSQHLQGCDNHQRRNAYRQRDQRRDLLDR
jgi:autotransporter-associated beta strand protein